MDSQTSASRGRARSSTRKRHTFPTFSSSPYTTTSTITAAGEPAEQILPSRTPSANMALPSFSFETPSPSASRGTRTRTRVTDTGMSSSHDPDNKGGRSLRKRARVDYTFDQADEEASDGNKATPFGLRALKKRRTDLALHETEIDEDSNARVKRRSSEQPSAPPASATRRRTQLRKTVEPLPSISLQTAEEVEVQDTIEVGGHQSELSDESTLRRTSTSTGSSNTDSRPSLLTTSLDTLPTPQKPTVNHPLEDKMPIDDEVQPAILDSSQTIPGDGPTNLEVTSANLADEPPRTSNELFSPYIKGIFVDHSSTQADAEPEEPTLTQEDPAEDMPDADADGVPAGSFLVDAGQDDTPMTDSLQPESAVPYGLNGITPGVTPEAETAANSPAAEQEPVYSQPHARQPIKFKKTREASEFINLFDDFKSLSHEELYKRLTMANNALESWQDEFNELRKLTDDEANAVRYRQEEAAFEHRLKMLTSKDPEANPVRKDFVVKGIRAERPDPEIAYLRQQDRLMSQNYFFEYDDRESKIGNQDPLEQKAGAGKGRLRDRPKQTLKAAEADDPNVVHGKRTRKAPALFDGSEAASRASTPAPTQRRRRKAGQAADDKDIAESLPIPPPVNLPVEQTPKKKGKGGRPRKNPLPDPVPEDDPVAMEEPEVEPQSQEQPEPEVEEKTGRKRRRRAGLAAEPEDAEAPSEPKKKRRNISNTAEVPTESFYASTSRPNNTREGSRPPTSSSTATQSTVASVSNSYQLREKRQKKFTLDPEEEGLDEEAAPEPKRKRAKRSKKTQVEDFAVNPLPTPDIAFKVEPPPVGGQLLETTAPAPAPAVTTKTPKFKIKGNYNPTNNHSRPAAPTPTSAPPNPFSVPSSSNSTPPAAPNGVAANGEHADEKDYSQMTKSEKMSHSMKARWASGSMSQAVAKRRATLADKKKLAKETDSGPATPATTPAPTQP